MATQLKMRHIVKRRSVKLAIGDREYDFPVPNLNTLAEIEDAFGGSLDVLFEENPGMGKIRDVVYIMGKVNEEFIEDFPTSADFGEVIDLDTFPSVVQCLHDLMISPSTEIAESMAEQQVPAPSDAARADGSPSFQG